MDDLSFRLGDHGRYPAWERRADTIATARYLIGPFFILPSTHREPSGRIVMPPIIIVPPSATLTEVLTVVFAKIGNWVVAGSGVVQVR